MHGLRGYREVVQSLEWGLSQLGHEVSVTENSVAANCTNILIGHVVVPPERLAALPKDTIVYNLEQMGGVPVEGLSPCCQIVADRFQVWEYSPRNLDAWKRFNTVRPPVVVPVSWAAPLERIPKVAAEDIDVFLYGKSCVSRLEVFHELSEAGVRCVFACGLYGAERDALIARSKIVLNINLYYQTRIFEVVRASYLLANRKAVLADRHPETFVEPDLEDAVCFAPRETLVQRCLALLNDEPARKELETRGYEIFRRRDIRETLKPALAAL
jgi:hypothetical protein